jgi:hypothetical protein
MKKAKTKKELADQYKGMEAFYDKELQRTVYRYKKPEHTATPWFETNIGEIVDGEVHIKAGKSGNTVAIVFTEADADFVVRAVNAHEELLDACKYLLLCHRNDPRAGK